MQYKQLSFQTLVVIITSCCFPHKFSWRIYLRKTDVENSSPKSEQRGHLSGQHYLLKVLPSVSGLNSSAKPRKLEPNWWTTCARQELFSDLLRRLLRMFCAPKYPLAAFALLNVNLIYTRANSHRIYDAERFRTLNKDGESAVPRECHSMQRFWVNKFAAEGFGSQETMVLRCLLKLALPGQHLVKHWIICSLHTQNHKWVHLSQFSQLPFRFAACIVSRIGKWIN